MNGIDISNYQSGISLSSVKPEFVIAKISEGTCFIDRAFDIFYTDCKNLGIPIGAYVYSHSTTEDLGKKEAEYALSLLKGRKLDLPVFLDIEGSILTAGKDALMRSATAFFDAIKANGYKAGVYASLYTYQTYLDLSALRDRDICIWLAQWGVSSPSIPCDIWQKNVGHINGYSGEIDLDVMYEPVKSSVVEIKQEKIYPADMSVLCRGFYGTQVNAWQGFLKGLGYLSDVTGIFDEKTESATVSYQKDHALISDGIVGPKTYATIK